MLLSLETKGLLTFVLSYRGNTALNSTMVPAAAETPTNVHTSTQTTAYKILDAILDDFGLQRNSHGSSVKFVGEVPGFSAKFNDNINLSLIGAIPSLANAVAATQIYEARGGQSQTIEVDLRKAHNYLDPDTGMTPTINGQVSIQIDPEKAQSIGCQAD